MPIKRDPIISSCHFCGQKFSIKFVPPRKAYSQKNDWNYWTEKEENKGKKICDDCLRSLCKNYKKELKNSIINPKLRKLLATYLATPRYKDSSKNLFKEYS